VVDKKNSGAGGAGASRNISFLDGKKATKLSPAKQTCKPREALIDACWDASTTHAAATTASILTFVIGQLRRHPDHSLDRTIDRLMACRQARPDPDVLHIGRAAINSAIDLIIDADNNFTSFPASRRDEAATRGKMEKRK
jgi:hypothetical protein